MAAKSPAGQSVSICHLQNGMQLELFVSLYTKNPVEGDLDPSKFFAFRVSRQHYKHLTANLLKESLYKEIALKTCWCEKDSIFLSKAALFLRVCK